MPSTFSPSLRLELIGAGEQAGTWNITTNNNLGTLLEQSISGNTALDLTASDVTLTALNGVTDQSRSAVLSITGTPGTTRVVTIPNVRKAYTVRNRSDSTVNIKTASGTPFSIPTLSEAYIYCDANNVITGRFITDGAQNTILNTQTPFNNVALTGIPTAPTAAFGTNTTQVATTAFVQAALQALYPVGSVYINGSSTTNPATLFGFGTWTAIGAGRVLVGQDTGDAAFDVLGETGGSKDAIVVAHTHTGTTATVSTAHTHTFSATTSSVDLTHGHTGSGTTGNNNVDHSHSGTTAGANVDHTHNFSGSATTSAAGSHSHTINDPGHFHTNGRVASGLASGNNPNLSSVASNTGTSFTGISINAAGDHSHSVTIGGTTSGFSTNHVHSFSTGGQSTAHTHTYSFTTST